MITENLHVPKEQLHLSHWEFPSMFWLICRRSNKACVDLAKADPALANAFCTETYFKSCRCPRFDIREEIPGLTFGASMRPQFSGRSCLASYYLSFVSDNEADQLLGCLSGLRTGILRPMFQRTRLLRRISRCLRSHRL